jgi:hypothetical protein
MAIIVYGGFNESHASPEENKKKLIRNFKDAGISQKYLKFSTRKFHSQIKNQDYSFTQASVKIAFPVNTSQDVTKLKCFLQKIYALGLSAAPFSKESKTKKTTIEKSLCRYFSIKRAEEKYTRSMLENIAPAAKAETLKRHFNTLVRNNDNLIAFENLIFKLDKKIPEKASEKTVDTYPVHTVEEITR